MLGNVFADWRPLGPAERRRLVDHRARSDAVRRLLAPAFALALTALGAAPALAEDRDCDFANWDGSTTVRDRDGRMVGTVGNSGLQATLRDDRGAIVGTASQSSTGRTTYRDDRGSVIGTRDVTGAGNIVYRDDRGSIIDTAPAPLDRFCRHR